MELKNDNTNDSIIKKKRLQQCIIINTILLITIIGSILLFGNNDNKYLKYGPNDNLQPLGIPINTWNKYILFQILICFIKITEVYIGEIADPILGFDIYNPDKKIINHFTKNELQTYANSMWLISALRSALMVVILISQIDIALLQVLYGEIMSFYTIRLLLNDKKFPEDFDSLSNVSNNSIDTIDVTSTSNASNASNAGVFL